jgi:hypothetical protein
MKNVIIRGKRWFQKSYGNTYNSLSIIVDGEEVAYLPMSYGYGDFYMQRAADWLEENGYMPERGHYSFGGAEQLWTYCSRNNIQCNYYAEDVSRKRDL